MSTLGRSWLLTRITLRIVFTRDRELLLFPLVSWLMVMGAALTSTLVVRSAPGMTHLHVHTDERVVFGVVVLLALVNTLFGLCITHTTRVRLEGGDATLGQSLSFGARRFHLGLAWLLCSLVASIVLGTVRGSSRKAGVVGGLLLRPIAWLVETAWSIAKLLVIPAIVYEGHGPIGALRASVRAVKQTWGEALTRHLGFGAVASVLYAFGFGLAMVTLLALPGGSTLQMIGLLFTLGYFTAVITVLHLVHTVFNTALYHYATRGEAGLGFSEEILGGAVRRTVSTPG